MADFNDGRTDTMLLVALLMSASNWPDDPHQWEMLRRLIHRLGGRSADPEVFELLEEGKDELTGLVGAEGPGDAAELGDGGQAAFYFL